MNRYVITPEIKTAWWEKFLRFLRLYPKLSTYEIVFGGDYYEVGEILSVGLQKVKIVKKYGESI